MINKLIRWQGRQGLYIDEFAGELSLVFRFNVQNKYISFSYSIRPKMNVNLMFLESNNFNFDQIYKKPLIFMMRNKYY